MATNRHLDPGHRDARLRGLLRLDGQDHLPGDRVWYHDRARGHAVLVPLAHRTPCVPAGKKSAWTRRGLKTLALLVVGYGLWHVDLEFCAELRALRFGGSRQSLKCCKDKAKHRRPTKPPCNNPRTHTRRATWALAVVGCQRSQQQSGGRSLNPLLMGTVRRCLAGLPIRH
ncbi:hypothetical protein F5883DRAFT_174239 [Diaporthe sp. PMI_573]|nr:hypothetical protein F5883DRAFT_174239 [Diaporthaceae sp. PMI_573]